MSGFPAPLFRWMYLGVQNITIGSEEFGNLTVIGTEPRFFNLPEPSARTATYQIQPATPELDGRF